MKRSATRLSAIALATLMLAQTASATVIEGNYAMSGIGANCVEAHVQNRMQLAERARLQCVNQAGRVRVVNMTNQQYTRQSCSMEGLRKATAFGSFRFDCR